MEKYVAVLGRQPLISVAELESLFTNVKIIAPNLAEFNLATNSPLNRNNLPDINRLGGTLKIAKQIQQTLPEFFQTLPAAGKITLGLSDFSRKATPRSAQQEALKIKRILIKSGHSVRIVPNQTAILSSATTLHNKLYKPNKLEIIKLNHNYYQVVSVQQINSYVQRDQTRPARDAKVGMLPPKLAQILINLCGNLPAKSTLLDPFCGTGVVLQEAALIGYNPYGTDLNERMIAYSQRNLEWLSQKYSDFQFKLHVGDAQKFDWQAPIDAVACETYLGPPMSQPPADIKLKQAKQECKSIIVGFLKNLSPQIVTNTPVVIAVPAWLRPDNHYERLNLLDEIDNLSYNVVRFKNLGQRDLLYHRDGQVVAREIIVLRKK